MLIQVTILSAFTLLYWCCFSLILCRGAVRGTRTLGEPSRESVSFRYPRVSIILAARDEAEALPRSLESLLALDYPDYEVIAVNDRSNDATGQILQRFCALSGRLRALQMDSLPSGWLGKTHALQEGYRLATGQWLLFTDADVMMERGVLRAALWDAERNKRDHLALFPRLQTEHYLEAAFSNYFAFAFHFRYRPWDAKKPGSKAYAGIGAFNLVRKSIYEKAGTHRRLALDVADDMALGKIMKIAGASSETLYGHKFVSVRWVKGVSGVIRALHKNAFRGLNYSITLLVLATAGLFIVDVAPFIIMLIFDGIPRLASLLSALLIFTLYAGAYIRQPSRYFTFWTHPVIALLFIAVLWRSALSALCGGGVDWRGTRYPLKDLKKGMV